MENVRKKMKKIDKPDESADSSSVSCLPDEIVLQILSRLIDLKTLCRCKLVSIRFNFNHIVQQVNAISVPITSIDRPSIDSNSSGAPSERARPVNLLLKCEYFVSVMKSLQTFSALKSLSIEIPPIHEAKDNDFLFKWKFESGNRTRSFLFLSPTSICDMKENVWNEEEQEEEIEELSEMKLIDAAGYCFGDVIAISSKMRQYIKCFPLLENVTITDAGKRGRLSLCGDKLLPETIEQMLTSFRNNKRMRWCYVPLLKLPVSGYIMKGVFLFQVKVMDLPGVESSVNKNLKDFEDKEEAAYTEAVMEIFKRDKGWKEA